MSAQFLVEELPCVSPAAEIARAQEASPKKHFTAEFIEGWLVEQLTALLAVGSHEVSVSEPFAHYGLDSVAAVSLSGDLEDLLDRELSPTLIWDYPTIESLAKHLTEEAFA